MGQEVATAPPKRLGRPPGANPPKRRRYKPGDLDNPGRGRPRTWNIGRVQPLLVHLRAGTTLIEAAHKAGLDPDLVHQWQVRYPEFSQEIMAARAAAALNMPDEAKRILDAADARIEQVDRRLASAIIMSARNRADLVMRTAAIWNRRMSERFYIHGDADGGPIKVEIRTFSSPEPRAHAVIDADVIDAKPVPEGARPSIKAIESDS